MTRALLVLAALLAWSAVGDQPAVLPLYLAVGGQTADYLEPCGCGGQNAGGLARRVAMVRALRPAHPGLLTIELGGYGVQEGRLAVTTRSLGYLGVDAGSLSADDLVLHDRLAPLAADAALPLTSLVPPRSHAVGRAAAPVPPRSLVLGPVRGWRVGVVAVALPEDSLRALTDRLRLELTRLGDENRCNLTILISHLDAAGTEQVMTGLAPALRPRLVLLARGHELSEPTWDRLGATWVPVAHKGRSLSLVTLTRGARGVTVAADQMMVYPGARDATVQRWVDDYFAALRAGQVTGPPAANDTWPAVTSCAPCHGAAVAAWRRHPHARAVETLEASGRDVSACLTCHAESMRRLGLRPVAAGDRGVECASCHDGLEAHLATTSTAPGSAAKAVCESCHTGENSPHWAYDEYLAHVRSTCRGEVAPTPHEARGGQP